MAKTDWIIDGHQDIAFESLVNRRDYTLPIAKIRALESSRIDNQATLSWDAYQKGNIRLIFSTIFIEPQSHGCPPFAAGTHYATKQQFHEGVEHQLSFYRHYQNDYPDKFRLIATQEQLDEFLRDKEDHPDDGLIGLVLLLEGCEGLRSFDDICIYSEAGIRIIGPVWEGGHWCGGTFSSPADRLTAEGRTLLRHLAAAGQILDISHMNSLSAMDSLESYQGIVIASHANCRALLANPPNERQLDDLTIKRLIERDGVIGVIPFNEFLDSSWQSRNPREQVTLRELSNHIDHICQLAGDANHVAIGSDLDGGFGFPNIPLEMNDVGDLRLMEHILQQKGYHQDEITAVFHGNWLRILKKGLPSWKK